MGKQTFLSFAARIFYTDNKFVLKRCYALGIEAGTPPLSSFGWTGGVRPIARPLKVFCRKG